MSLDSWLWLFCAVWLFLGWSGVCILFGTEPKLDEDATWRTRAALLVSVPLCVALGLICFLGAIHTARVNCSLYRKTLKSLGDAVRDHAEELRIRARSERQLGEKAAQLEQDRPAAYHRGHRAGARYFLTRLDDLAAQVEAYTDGKTDAAPPEGSPEAAEGPSPGAKSPYNDDN